MTRRRAYTPLFLFELLVSLGLFAVCAAVCLEMFAASHRIQAENQALSGAILVTQNTAETLRSLAAADAPTAAEALSGTLQGEGFSLAFDQAWQPCAPGEAQHTLTCVPDEEPGLTLWTLSADGDAFTLRVAVRKGAGA